MNEMRKLMETVKKLIESRVNVRKESSPHVAQAINAGVMIADQEFGDFTVTDYSNEHVIQAIRTGAIEIDIENMSPEEKQAIVDGGVEEALDMNQLGNVYPAEWIY